MFALAEYSGTVIGYTYASTNSYTSNDSGATWTPVTLPTAGNWVAAAGKNIVAPPAKKKLTIYTYEQLKTEKYKMDELRKLCMQYKVSRAGNKEDITKRLYDYCKSSIVPLKIQKVVRGFLHRKLIKLRGPAFKKRNMCTNETDFFTELHLIKN